MKPQNFNNFYHKIHVLYNCGRILIFILSFFVGYILSFGLVRLRSIRLSAQVGAHIERRCSRSHREDVIITDVIIKPRIEIGLGMWMTSCPEAMSRGFWVIFEKKKLVDIWNWTSELRSEPRWVQLGLRDALRVVGSDETVSILKNVSLSPRAENLKVKKVIKVSYLNYRDSSVFRDSDCCERSTYLNISHIRILVIFV